MQAEQNKYMRKIVVAITGASGSVYAKSILQKLSTLKDHWNDLGIIMSANARQVWQTELEVEARRIFPFLTTGIQCAQRGPTVVPFTL